MTDEIDNLCRFLDEQRAVLRHKAGDLDATQLQRTLPPSDLTLGGMVNHLAFVEDWWFRRTLQDDQDAYWAAVDWDADRDWEWHSAADDDPDRLWARYDAAVTRAQEAVAADPRGERESVHPRRSGEPFTLRWILAHMVQEYARHNGHADLIRQSIDGQVGDP